MLAGNFTMCQLFDACHNESPMVFGILPVKSPKDAKQRLSGLLSREDRERLAWAMYEQMLDTLCTVDGFDRLAVATADPEVAGHACDCGVDVFLEDEQHSHSRSADAASARAIAMGATSVVLLPIDIPLVTRAEIESLIAAAGPGVVIVPSGDGTGTNALVRNPPDAIPACFGPDSLRKHCAQANSFGVPMKIVRPPGILLDVDTPEDVAELLSRAPENPIAQLLRASVHPLRGEIR